MDMQQRASWKPRQLRTFDRIVIRGQQNSAVPAPRLGGVAAQFGRPFIEQHPDTVVIGCADGRYTIVEWDVLKALGLTRVPDYPFAPGGPGRFHRDTNRQPLDRAAQHDDLAFLIGAHAVKRVILIAHDECGYYRARFAERDAAWIRARQLADLVEVRADLSERHPACTVECYYAIAEDGHVSLRYVEI